MNPMAENGRWQSGEELRWTARHWATRMQVQLRQIHLRSMATKWASISQNGRLTLNKELLDVPRPLGEYVIVHELAHLLAPNHGKLFKSFMTAYMPDWEEREQKLRQWE
jgi:predicted metal-dependent hydrolase